MFTLLGLSVTDRLSSGQQVSEEEEKERGRGAGGGGEGGEERSEEELCILAGNKSETKKNTALMDIWYSQLNVELIQDKTRHYIAPDSNIKEF